MKYINLGCGPKYSKNNIWVNADMKSENSDVIECNFLNGIPFKTHEFDLVYHSHVIEHFSKKDAELFISECYRILNKNGVIRIACPNLEVIAREYLRNLERAFANEENGEEDYDWIMLELYDQTVRNTFGGDMLNYFKKKEVSNLDYVSQRVGNIAKEWHQNLSKEDTKNIQPRKEEKKSFLSNLLNNSSATQNNEEKMYNDIGKFRLGGEIHQWMYDRFSLKRLLEKVGFIDVTLCTATTSFIDNWASFKLDNPEEKASIFIEARK